MSTRYQAGRGLLRLCQAAPTTSETPRCRSVRSDTLERAVAERLLAAVAPEQIALALAAADAVADRRARATRAVELALERARYEAARAERAFHACEPEHRLVARSLESRWEAAGRARRGRAAARPPGRRRAAAAARRPRGARADLPRLWAAPHYLQPRPQAAAARADHRRHADL